MTTRIPLLLALCAAALPVSAATIYEWTFNSGDLSAAAGNGTMSAAGAADLLRRSLG